MKSRQHVLLVTQTRKGMADVTSSGQVAEMVKCSRRSHCGVSLTPCQMQLSLLVMMLNCWASAKIHHHLPFMQSSLLFSSSTSSKFISAPWHSSCPTSTTPPSRPPSKTPCRSIPRNEERGPLATETPLTGCEPNLFDIPEDNDDVDEIFTDRNFTQLFYNSNGQYPDPVEIDDEHLRSEFASQLQMEERGAKTDLAQTHYSHEESLLRSAPLISRTENPGSVLNDRESSQGLEDEILMSALQVQRRSKI